MKSLVVRSISQSPNLRHLWATSGNWRPARNCGF